MHWSDASSQAIDQKACLGVGSFWVGFRFCGCFCALSALLYMSRVFRASYVSSLFWFVYKDAFLSIKKKN